MRAVLIQGEWIIADWMVWGYVRIPLKRVQVYSGETSVAAVRF